MKYRKYKIGNNGGNSLPEDLVEAIIRVAYKDAGLKERIRINKLARTDEKVKILLEDYRATAKTVHSIKPDECPPELMENLNLKSGFVKLSKPSVFLDLYTAVFTKPAVTAAAVTVMVVAILISVNLDRTPDYGRYKKADVELADRQAKYALSIIGKVFKSTTNSLANDILAEKVSKPINEGINTVNKLFNQEEVKK